MQNIDPLEFANILATELWCQQLANLEGLQSGVPTRTTATITPTQLRNFEQTYIELTNCRGEQASHAGFVPPSVTNANNYGILNTVGYCESGPTTALHVSPGPLSASDSSSSPGLPAPKRRNMGGRRPTKTPQDLSPEEEERRKIRRERNKMAAARCRKRRLDHTNELQDETDKLEEKKQSLLEEIRKLQTDQEHLQVLLRNHLQSCRLNRRSTSPMEVKPPQDPYAYPDVPEDGVRVKVEVMEPAGDPVLGLDSDIFTSPTPDKKIMLSAANPSVVTSGGSLDTPPATRPNRPNFLHVPVSLTPAQIHNSKAMGNNKIAGIEISTPSNGIPFNFDSLMEGGTGLTPVHPHPHPCAQQQRSAPDLASPDHGSLVWKAADCRSSDWNERLGQVTGGERARRNAKAPSHGAARPGAVQEEAHLFTLPLAQLLPVPLLLAPGGAVSQGKPADHLVSLYAPSPPHRHHQRHFG